MKKLQLVRVQWGDAWAFGGWYRGEPPVPLSVVDVGFLVEKTKEGILLASSVSNNVGAIKFIPKGMIKKITKIKGQTVEYEDGRELGAARSN